MALQYRFKVSYRPNFSRTSFGMAFLFTMILRITSYNVCYTKLLRGTYRTQLAFVARLLTRIILLLPRLKHNKKACTFDAGSSLYLFQKESLLNNGHFTHPVRFLVLRFVITSYSIHYTKLYEPPPNHYQNSYAHTKSHRQFAGW